MHAALRVEFFHRLSHIAAREMLHHFFQRRVFLPHDFVEPRSLDSGFL